jgi:hypothetical protein
MGLTHITGTHNDLFPANGSSPHSPELAMLGKSSGSPTKTLSNRDKSELFSLCRADS